MPSAILKQLGTILTQLDERGFDLPAIHVATAIETLQQFAGATETLGKASDPDGDCLKQGLL